MQKFGYEGESEIKPHLSLEGRRVAVCEPWTNRPQSCPTSPLSSSSFLENTLPFSLLNAIFGLVLPMPCRTCPTSWMKNPTTPPPFCPALQSKSTICHAGGPQSTDLI